MAYELRDEQGSLWKNDKRETDKHPHARGQAKIGGVVYWVDAWTNVTGDGKKYQTLKFKPKDEQPTFKTNTPRVGEPNDPRRALNDELDEDPDSIPF